MLVQQHSPRTGAPTAQAVAQRVELSDEARALLQAGASPQEFVGRLLDAKRHVDALRFLAGWLPPREAVWWACLAIWKLDGPQLPAPEQELLRRAVAWVREPTEPHRRDAEQAAAPADLTRPVTWAARAAGWAGTGGRPPDHPELVARAVGNVIHLAACLAGETDGEDEARHCVVLGLDVAGGRCPWPTNR